MTRVRLVVTGVISALVLAGLFLFFHGPKTPIETAPTAPVEEVTIQPTATPLAEASHPVAPPMAAAQAPRAERMSGIDHAITDDPHLTPESVTQFAEEMSEPMEAAMKDEETAVKFFPKLADCASDKAGSASLAIRAICLSNAEQLTEKYPERFGDLFSKLVGDLPVEVVKLSNSMN